MPKKQPTALPQVIETNPRTSGSFDYTDADTLAATSLGIVLAGSLEERIGRAIYAFNNATRYAVEAGYLLLSVKAEVEHGQFTQGIEELGLSSQRAAELMRMAKFATSLPDERRAEMLTLPKSKVLALAGADAAVIEDLLEVGDGNDLNILSVRELRMRIRSLEKQATDTATERDTFEAERDGLAKKLKKRARDAEDHEGTPLVIADMRAELAALVKKAELSIDSTYPLLTELVGLGGNQLAGAWVKPTVRLAMSGLVALHMQLIGVIKSCADALGEKAEALRARPDSLAHLDQGEIAAVAEEWAQLTATHSHEAELRKHERKQAQPRGKGRPADPPKAPKA